MKRLESLLVGCLVVALVLTGFALGLVISEVVKTEAQAEEVQVEEITLLEKSEWATFLNNCPEFRATDSNCLELQRLAVENETTLGKAYYSYYTGEELRLRNEAEKEREEARGTLVRLFGKSEWTSFLKNCPEFEATDSNCARLEEKALQIEEGLEDAYSELLEEERR